MSAVIQILNGPRSGNKVLLRAGQALVFGRTQWADVIFKTDTRMSGKHFSLELQHGRLRIRDLESANGTFVNKQAAQDTWLKDGDEITAGETLLTVGLQGVADVSEEQADLQPSVGALDPPPAIVPQPAIAELSYRREECSSGLTRLRGGKFGEAHEAPSAGALASQLAAACPLTLLVHPQLIERPELAELPAAVPLFDWLPAEQALHSSPLILPAASCPDWAQLIDAAWDKNAVLCFFSQQAEPELIAHFRSALRFRVTGPAVDATEKNIVSEGDEGPAAATDSADKSPPDAMLAYCWPKVLSALLDASSKPLTQQLLAGIEAVLMEVSDEPDSWQIVCGSDFSATLERAGLRELAAAPAASE